MHIIFKERRINLVQGVEDVSCLVIPTGRKVGRFVTSKLAKYLFVEILFFMRKHILLQTIRKDIVDNLFGYIFFFSCLAKKIKKIRLGLCIGYTFVFHMPLALYIYMVYLALRKT